MNKQERIALETKLANELVASCLNKEDKLLWGHSDFAFEDSCQHGKYFVIWSKVLGQIKVLDHIKVLDIACSSMHGFSVKIRNRAGDLKYIDHKPTRLWNYPLFSHIPHTMYVTYLQRGISEKVFRGTMMFKEYENPDHSEENSGPFVMGLSRFRATYPEHKSLILN